MTEGSDGTEGVEILPADRAGSFVLRMSGMDQSYVDLADPTRLVFEYVRRLGDVVDACAPAGAAVRVVHVGGAAMTLPRYVAATRPRSAQVVLEPAAGVTELVRRELPLSRGSGIKVRPVDGRAGVAALRDSSVDLLVVDAFADARVPASLVTPAFFADAARVLGDGVVALNLTDRAPFGWTRRAVASLRTAFPHLLLTAEPATLRAKRLGNLVVVASRGAVPLETLRRRATTAGSPYRVLDAAAVSDSFGGGTPFSDADAEPSPAP
ncbi:spermidine synthase [Nocardioides mangrovi]|uniref:Fused MFS/spermidine synthase n=1 Tax=Nocardioides mangrovi TaxID=2874580 RepID=A0ABS7UJQ0_9ACTN|nr:fused MFS/spermidine synthase [Nocardioides mangrovi]MBZ5740012.1 fused MFS/spermidine synthase [Nocardioides mangrovi]MBZ5740817.1 fused MFS/spermidine synthase [Nocardioides mangrovi]